MKAWERISERDQELMEAFNKAREISDTFHGEEVGKVLDILGVLVMRTFLQIEDQQERDDLVMEWINWVLRILAKSDGEHGSMPSLH